MDATTESEPLPDDDQADVSPWSVKEEAFALALASGATIEDAARKAGVSKSWAHRTYMKNDDLMTYVANLRKRILDQTIASLAAGCSEAAFTLRQLLRSGTEGIKLRSAVAVLDNYVKIRNSVELAAEVAEIKRRLDSNATTNPQDNES